MRIALAALLLGMGCSKPAPRPNGAVAQQPLEGATRTVVFDKEDSRHDIFEGPSFRNACASDAECKVGGCSGEVCSAEEGVNTTCVVHPDQPRDATCGCVRNECVWYRDGQSGAAQGMPCEEGRCEAGLTCVSYVGIAGARGPRFTSCEIPCNLPTSVCPEGQTCLTIADGPGAVCRPR